MQEERSSGFDGDMQPRSDAGVRDAFRSVVFGIHHVTKTTFGVTKVGPRHLQIVLRRLQSCTNYLLFDQSNLASRDFEVLPNLQPFEAFPSPFVTPSFLEHGVFLQGAKPAPVERHRGRTTSSGRRLQNSPNLIPPPSYTPIRLQDACASRPRNDRPVDLRQAYAAARLKAVEAQANPPQ